MGYGREGAGADSGRTLRRDACGPDRRGHLCFVPTTEAANNQYSTSSTQHGHHTQIGCQPQESTGKLEGAMTSADAPRTSEREAVPKFVLRSLARRGEPLPPLDRAYRSPR